MLIVNAIHPHDRQGSGLPGHRILLLTKEESRAAAVPRACSVVFREIGTSALLQGMLGVHRSQNVKTTAGIHTTYCKSGKIFFHE